MVKLGDEVRDTISGFQGIAVARTDWIYGCIRINVQPPVDSEGKLPESISFDEPQLDIVVSAKFRTDKEPVISQFAGAVEKAMKEPGGPVTRGMNQGKNIKR